MAFRIQRSLGICEGARLLEGFGRRYGILSDRVVEGSKLSTTSGSLPACESAGVEPGPPGWRVLFGSASVCSLPPGPGPNSSLIMPVDPSEAVPSRLQHEWSLDGVFCGIMITGASSGMMADTGPNGKYELYCGIGSGMAPFYRRRR